MNTYWGDLHNHCGITYGFGSLANAIKRAKSQLDFAAFTGHAMWPDMYEKKWRKLTGPILWQFRDMSFIPESTATIICFPLTMNSR